MFVAYEDEVCVLRSPVKITPLENNKNNTLSKKSLKQLDSLSEIKIAEWIYLKIYLFWFH
jgi:hypothetical protein